MLCCTALTVTSSARSGASEPTQTWTPLRSCAMNVAKVASSSWSGCVSASSESVCCGLRFRCDATLPNSRPRSEDPGLVHLRLGERDRAVNGERRRAGAALTAQEHHDSPSLAHLAGRRLHAL